jgi:hypothetical protein
MREGDVIQLQLSHGGQRMLGVFEGTQKRCGMLGPTWHRARFGSPSAHGPCCTNHLFWLRQHGHVKVPGDALVVLKNLTHDMCARKIQHWWRTHRLRTELRRSTPMPSIAVELVLRSLVGSARASPGLRAMTSGETVRRVQPAVSRLEMLRDLFRRREPQV